MSIDQIFPKSLFEPGNRRGFVRLLASLSISAARRKQTYFEWLRLTDQNANPTEIKTLEGA